MKLCGCEVCAVQNFVDVGGVLFKIFRVEVSVVLWKSF